MIRIHPTGAAGGARAFWSLPAVGGSFPLQIPRGTVALWLDPARTTPNVMIGVEAPNLSPTFMRPGDVLPIRQGTASIWNVYKGGPFSPPLAADDDNRMGHMSIVALMADDMPGLIASKDRQPAPQAGVLYQGCAQAALFPTYGIRGIRINVFSIIQASSLVNNTPPADFACDLDVQSLAPNIAYNPAGSDETTPGATQLISLDEIAPVSWYAGNNRSEQRLAVTSLDRCFDRVVAVGGYMQLVATAIVGTGVLNNKVFYSVEAR